jgi:fibronectin-binding autotransporter adhesin
MPLPVKGAAAAPPSPGYGMWARTLGAWSNADGALLGGFNNVSYDEKLWAVQGGLDAVIAQSNAGTLLASGFLHYGGINTRSANTLTGSPAGTVDTNGWGGGVSLTYAAQGGFYLDGVATYTRYDLDVTAAAGGTASTKADGWTISGEVGHRFAVTNWIALIPQAQVTYQRIALSGFTDNVGVTTGFSDADSLEGRLGARLELAGTPVARFYVGGNFLHEFLSNPVANVAGTPLALDFDGSGYQFEAGVRVGQVGGRVSAWLRGDYRAPFDAANGIATWNAMGGVAVRF